MLPSNVSALVKKHYFTSPESLFAFLLAQSVDSQPDRGEFAWSDKGENEEGHGDGSPCDSIPIYYRKFSD
jgi:hypothetical protein